MKTSINKSKLFSSAWTMVKNYAMSLSEALVKAWKYAKENSSMVFINVARETEKAVAMNVWVSNGSVSTSEKIYGRQGLIWFPKSMMINGCVPMWMYNQKLRQYI